ncbi:MAG: hypothetical protein ABR600_06235 [Actinomycetota bacterium]
MAERLRALPEDGLAAALASLAGSVAFPRVDVAAGVRAGLAERPAARGRVVAFPRARTFGRAGIVAVAAVMLFGAAAVAGRLGVPGLRIVFGPEQPPRHAAVGRNLFLGSPSTLSAARERLRFALYTPRGESLGPASVDVGDAPPGGRLSLVYPPGPDLPRSRFTRAGLLITEFRGDIDGDWLKKLAYGGTSVEYPPVNGYPGVWLTGDPHEVQFVDRNGIPFQDSVRLAGNVLVWSENGVTLRLECACSKGTAVRIGESMR